MHLVTIVAVAIPLLVSLLCVRAGVQDSITHLLLLAIASSFSGTVMWLRSRYIATRYLNERQARKTHFTNSVRQRYGDGAPRPTTSERESGAPTAPPPRTLARLSPVLPAFQACCFFLLSVSFTVAAALRAIWFVRSLDWE